jgi:protein TonB
MDNKKSSAADLENKKSIFIQIGLVVSLSLTLIAFEWTSKDVQKLSGLSVSDIEAEEEIIPITHQEEIKAPPPPPPPKISDVLTIVENNTNTTEDININSEMNENATVEIVATTNDAYSVEEEESEEDKPVFFIVEEMPEFPGGTQALQEYIAKSIRYPVIAQENGIQGRVFVSFIVNSKGMVDQVKIVRGIDSNLDKEAVRVIQSLPQWKPGKQRGKPVKVSYTVPINFILQ